jgi:hypothetical protein
MRAVRGCELIVKVAGSEGRLSGGDVWAFAGRDTKQRRSMAAMDGMGGTSSAAAYAARRGPEKVKSA